LRKFLIFLNLLAIFGGKSVDDDRGYVKEQDASGEIGGAFSGELVFLKGGDEECAVGEGCDGGPHEGGNGAEINGGGYDWEIVDRIVVAVDADVASVIEEKSGEKDLDDDGIGGAAFWKPGDEAAFEELEDADGEKDDLFMNFVNGRKEGESEEEKEPEDIEPIEGGALAIEHFGLEAPGVNLAWN
jgi:hypothetical protein